MNFFEHQDRARSSTKLLVALFACAIVALILITSFLAVVLLGLAQRSEGQPLPAFSQEFFASDIFLTVSAVVLAIVTLGTSYRLLQLRGGGTAVAEGLGGRLLNVNTRDADERKVLNVVEEMAIAAGLPVPRVYLLEDPAINAFAAGYDPQDAVIGVTRGCIRQLNRDELQGVVAHEFSHILNGDMRLNIRLIGWLYGIMVIGLIGYHLLRSMRYARSSRKNGGGLLFLGLGLMAVGYGGTFFGNLIKAAVSRQREFLADASAVQYTRNPGGIGGALKKIAGYAGGTVVTAADTAEISHMLFGPGAHFALFATHPPIDERIRRLDPHWKGEAALARAGAGAASGGEALSAKSFAGTVGQPTAASLHEAQQRLAALPEQLQGEAHSSFGSYLTVFALIIAASDHAATQVQWQYLREQLAQPEFDHLLQIHALVTPMERKLYLPLVDLAMPALHQLSVRQCQAFMTQLQQLMNADARVSLFEWCLYRTLRVALLPRVTHAATLELEQCAAECRVLMSALAREGHGSEEDAAKAFAAGMAALQQEGAALADLEQATVSMLDRAVERLRLVKPLQKPRLLKALVLCIRTDGEVTSGEAEILRAVGAVLNCPVPPLA